MTFNEFQRELQRRGIDPHNAFMLSLVYEQVSAMSVRLNDCATVLLQMAKTIEELTSLSADTRAQLRKVQRGGRPDGVEVFSVRSDPDDK
jgi:hypothetical protein